jgi:VanZ family protein
MCFKDRSILSTARKPSRPEPLWKAWLAAGLWLGLIIVESSNEFSSENTSRFLYPILHFLLGLDPFQFLEWHVYLRKSGHVIGYAVMSALFFRAWRVTIPVRGTPRWSIVWARIAFFMTTLVASLDEWHQGFLPSRTGKVSDVLLDGMAAFGAQVLLYVLLQGWRKAALTGDRSLQAAGNSLEQPTIGR